MSQNKNRHLFCLQFCMTRKARKRIPESSEEEQDDVSRFNNHSCLPAPRGTIYSDNGGVYVRVRDVNNCRAYSQSRSTHRLDELDEPSQPDDYYIDSSAEYEPVEEENNASRSTSFPSKTAEFIKNGSSDTNAAANSADLPRPVYHQISSYIHVAPMPVFHGRSRECPVKHLSRFRKVCRANNVISVEMMMRIFQVTLEDEAALWYLLL